MLDIRSIISCILSRGHSTIFQLNSLILVSKLLGYCYYHFNIVIIVVIVILLIQTSKALASTSSNIDIVGIISFLREGGGRAANSGASSVIGSFTVCTEASLRSPGMIR